MRVGREHLRGAPESLRPYLAEYTQRLASMARQYPWQWYNFYPFWDEALPQTNPPRDTPQTPASSL
jgi:predicted LPLAT superfamily acyltransferase